MSLTKTRQKTNNTEIDGRNKWKHCTIVRAVKPFGHVKEQDGYFVYYWSSQYTGMTQHKMCRFLIDSITKTEFFENNSIINSRAATLSIECEIHFLQFWNVWLVTGTFPHNHQHSDLCVHLGQLLFRNSLILRDYVYGWWRFNY